MVHFGQHARFVWCVTSIMAALIVGIDPMCSMLQKPSAPHEKKGTQQFAHNFNQSFYPNKNLIAIQ